MIVGWYDRLRATALYKGFLRHRVWAAERILAAPWVQGGFALGTIMTVWLILPVMLCLVIALPMLIHFGDGVYVTTTAALVFLVFVAFGPIIGLTFSEFLPVYFTIFWAVLGKKHLAHKHLSETKDALADWESRHV